MDEPLGEAVKGQLRLVCDVAGFLLTDAWIKFDLKVSFAGLSGWAPAPASSQVRFEIATSYLFRMPPFEERG